MKAPIIFSGTLVETDCKQLKNTSYSYIFLILNQCVFPFSSLEFLSLHNPPFGQLYHEVFAATMKVY